MQLPDSLSLAGLKPGTKEYARMTGRRYYYRHRDKEKARTKIWRLSNPDKYKKWVEKNRIKLIQAARRHDHQVTSEWFELKLKQQNGRCAICNKIPKRFDIDQTIPVVKEGKVVINVIVVCYVEVVILL